MFKTVSAASIIAKYHWDFELNHWEYIEKNLGVSEENLRKVGCGYPGDPVTKFWLKSVIDDVFGFPLIVRFSWSTCRKMIEE